MMMMKIDSDRERKGRREGGKKERKTGGEEDGRERKGERKREQDDWCLEEVRGRPPCCITPRENTYVKRRCIPLLGHGSAVALGQRGVTEKCELRLEV